MRKLFGAALGSFVAGLSCLATTAARANGRLPAATGLAIHPSDEQQLLLGLTYGLALSRDGGSSWTWMCEGQIEGNGGDVDPAIVMTSDGTLVVLSLTNGGVLVSQDDGCSFERAMGPLQRQRGVDLTLDPSQAGRVLALLSTVIEMSDAGQPRYRNLVAHSLDHGRSWEVLAYFRKKAQELARLDREWLPNCSSQRCNLRFLRECSRTRHTRRAGDCSADGRDRRHGGRAVHPACDYDASGRIRAGHPLRRHGAEARVEPRSVSSRETRIR